MEMQLIALKCGRCVQASEAAAIGDASEAASAACSHKRVSTSPAATAVTGAAPALESHDPSPDPDPAAKPPPARTSSAAEADALLADIAATVVALEDVEAPEAHIDAPLQLQEPALGPGALSNGLGTIPGAPAVSRKGGDAIPVDVDCGSGFTVAAAHAIWAAPALQPFSSEITEALRRSGE